jgi:signal transduction histidine kinase
LGPVLPLILIVALPTAAVLWLMNEATENERLAVRQRLADVYRAQLEIARQGVVAGWRERLVGLDAAASGHSPAQAFAACAGRALADSVIVLDPSGKSSYPAASISSPREAADDDAQWRAANRLEFTDRDYAGAARAYAKIALAARDDRLAARAIQAQVRSLLAAGEKTVAVQLLREQIENPRLQAATDPGGRWLWADLMLLLVETARDSDPPLALKTADLLVSRLENYDLAALGAVQRRFMMHELKRQFPDRTPTRTLAAEDLAAEYLERSTDRTTPRELQAAGVEGVWKIASPSGRVLALFRTATLLSILNHKLNEQVVPAGIRLAIRPPFDVATGSDEFLSAAAGSELPLWKVSLTLADDPFEGAAAERGRFYLWTALLTIVATGSLGLIVAGALRRQMRRSQLKNDLVATVSHELKTPLAAIRLLVDTLLDQQRSDPQQTREYLQLVARENERLSRLIDNFLTFSRIERGKQQFAAVPVEPAEIARRAAEALHERLHEPSCHFEVRVEPELPPVAGDFDALVMVLVNLLDNALKYSGPEKRIVLSVRSRANHVCVAVEDNGLGLSLRHKRRVFDRFYQVDQQLTRAAGGCGLGLSIVRSIVAAHGGSVAAESELGKGSTFLVTLPAIPASQPSPRSKDPCTTS